MFPRLPKAAAHRRPDMTGSDENYVFDEESGEWLPASELAAKRAAEGAVEVRDAVGNLLADGDQVTLIKDLEVKGAGRTLKQGTLIKSIRLTGDPQEIDCKFEGIKGLVLRAEFVRKR
jgi:protein PhnA